MGRGIFCVSDCWRDSANRWYEGGIRHEDARRGCCCGCHCNRVFEKLEQRVRPSRDRFSTDRSVNLDRIIEGDEDEMSISPVRLRGSAPPVKEASLCSHCCRCVEMKENGTSSRERPLAQVSVFYAMPTFLRELCGVTAFAPALRCRRISEEECECHNLWIVFFNEVMSAYENRYTSIVAAGSADED